MSYESGMAGPWTGGRPAAADEPVGGGVLGTPAVTGNRVTFTGDVVLNSFRALGIDKLDATWELVVDQGKVKTFTFAFSPASTARLQQARAGQAPLALTGAESLALVELSALLFVLGVALLALERRRP